MIDRYWILLLFDSGMVDLGELPLGGSREVRIGARNGLDKPVTFTVQGIVTDE